MHVCIYNCYIYINLQLYVHINKCINKYYINYMYMYICMCVCVLHTSWITRDWFDPMNAINIKDVAPRLAKILNK